jgi:glycerophosphoryl diester phosphodiesterase
VELTPPTRYPARELGSLQPERPSMFGPPLIVAHRAMTPGAVPNTVGAIASAARAGADLIELDVRLSLDRRPVLVHDALLGPSTTGRGWVRLWPSLALRRLHLLDDQALTISLLEEALSAVPPGVQLALHLKDRAALGTALGHIRRTRLAGCTWLWLEHPSDVRRATRSLPDLRVTLLRPDGWHGAGRERYFTEGQWAGANGVSLPAGKITAAMVKEAHQHQLRVFTRIDSPVQAPGLASLGVDGFITSDPAGTRALLYPT